MDGDTRKLADEIANHLRNVNESWREQSFVVKIALRPDQWALLIEALRATPPEPAPVAGDGWRTMDSAPKDGTRILTFAPALTPATNRYGGDGSERTNINEWHKDCWWRSRTDQQPTRWQPIPAPPGSASPPRATDADVTALVEALKTAREELEYLSEAFDRDVSTVLEAIEAALSRIPGGEASS